MKETQVRKGSAEAAAKREEKEAKKRQQLSVREQKAKKRQAKKDRKAKKDPNKPKRPPTAFFIYLEDFRKTYKKENPDVKGVAAVGKACGEKWKQLSEQEKGVYIAKAEQKRAEYERRIAAYNQKSAVNDGGNDEALAEESEKSKSEINDDDEDSGEEDDEEE